MAFNPRDQSTAILSSFPPFRISTEMPALSI